MNDTRNVVDSTSAFSEAAASSVQRVHKNAAELVSGGNRIGSAANVVVFANRVVSSTRNSSSNGLRLHVVIRDTSSATTISQANKLLSGKED